MKRSDLELLGIAAALLAAALMLSACKTTSSSESHMAASAAETLDATGHSETHVEEAPSKITTVEEVYAAGNEEAGEAGKAAVQGGAAPQRNARLLKRTVTVKEVGKVTTDTQANLKSQEREDSTLSSESESKKTRDFLHGPFALLGGLVALAGVAFAAFKLLKPRILP